MTEVSVAKVRGIVLALVCALTLLACAGMRDRDTVRQGLLVSGVRQQAFIDVWGPPERTSTMIGEDRLDAKWGVGGYLFKGRAAYDVWEYPARGVTLVFYRGTLATWKTDRTTSELKSKD
jgi:hypothetical protein